MFNFMRYNLNTAYSPTSNCRTVELSDTLQRCGTEAFSKHDNIKNRHNAVREEAM